METLIKQLTAEELELLPTEEHIAFYEERGWLITKKIIPDEIIDLVIAGSEKFYRGDRKNTY